MGGGAAAARVGTASQPASIAAESKARHGEMEALQEENERLQRLVEKKDKNFASLAGYAFNRFNNLVTETGHLADLYSSALRT